MKTLISVMSIWMITGCSTTSHIDAKWDEETARSVSEKASQITSARVRDESGAARSFARTIEAPKDASIIRATTEGLFFGEEFRHDELVEITMKRRNHVRGFFIGAGLGLITGWVAAEGVENAMCDVQSGCESSNNGNLVLGGTTALLFGMIGGAIGVRETTILRFRNGAVSASPADLTLSLRLSH